MKMRRSDRQLDDQQAVTILEQGEYGILSCVSENLNAYGVPMSYAYKNNKLYLHSTNQESHKLNCIRTHPQVCFTVVGATEVLPAQFTTKYASTVVFGKARIIQDAIEMDEGLNALLDKYSPNNRMHGEKYKQGLLSQVCVIEIDIESMSGKARK